MNFTINKFKMTNQEIERIGEKTIGFGKYRGKKLNTLPKDYLRYLYESHIVSVQNWNDVYWYAKETVIESDKNK